ncbi:uncharacterized protein UV8b_04001 [Ustilaginoidea virens]|uniref:Gfd2/YDR514C-like C-terminal domain-containing protein n=1 Tax=Ustilaginoidea virens TaxID=1159556 RepID=A0A8E5HQE7_USTVR|nr:uncharacterized protein UV8b_04001 [Ustilaginoidea virens]QUC19760.1 hypothetical protein UV8b_04001 [Ustilaginoidea virens]
MEPDGRNADGQPSHRSTRPMTLRATRAELAASARDARRDKLRDVQLRLGLPAAGAAPRPGRHRHHTTFVSIDLEAHEDQPGFPTEVGIAVLNTHKIDGVDPGPAGLCWWRFIEAHHLRVREFAGHVNRRYVQGCPDQFQFGASVIVPAADLVDALRVILSSYADGKQDVILAGHGLTADISCLDRIGLSAEGLPGVLGTVDTQALHQAWADGDRPRNLERVLQDLCVRCSWLHNAGNDAVFTLRALIAMAVEGPMPEGGTQRIPQLSTMDTSEL